jgi:hypothetical protein
MVKGILPKIIPNSDDKVQSPGDEIRDEFVDPNKTWRIGDLREAERTSSRIEVESVNRPRIEIAVRWAMCYKVNLSPCREFANSTAVLLVKWFFRFSRSRRRKRKWLPGQPPFPVHVTSGAEPLVRQPEEKPVAAVPVGLVPG